jgi:membrane-associated phospholipid phosphatase
MQNSEKLFEEMYFYEMPMSIFLDGVGFYGPIIVAVIVIYALTTLPKYMWMYFIGIISNSFINKYLKLFFLEERPKNPIMFSKYEKYQHEESFGMPSGHASAIGFSIVYLLLVKSHSIWLPLCAFIGILTLYQRVKYRRHTIEQVFMGTITGGVWGWIVYSLATGWIVWL